MNKSELVDAIATGADISKAAATRALDTTLQAITSAVAAGDMVSLVGFGSFKPSARKARTGKNPKTGEPIEIAATTVPKFTAGAVFKAAVKSGK